MRFLLIFLALVLCVPAHAFSPEEAPALSHSKLWLRLLHYKSHFFRGNRSAIDGSEFFFSPEGAKDPEKELLATVHAFQERTTETFGRLKQPAPCAFPARFRFLNENLKLGLTAPACPKWDEFLARFNGAESVTLVFSTAYPNNPASMFGHSFLRINSKAEKGKAKHDLLDQGLSYAAQVPPDENNFLFMWFGLTGGYPGSFSAIPYYAKVAEYNNSESRDLWEYDLNINAQETWWLLANVWEIEVNSYADYFFFDENCSYEILTLLEVAKPEWEVSDYFIHMIPAESVKKVTNVPGSVKGVKFRPSLYRRLMAYGDRLGPEDKQSFLKVVEGEEGAAGKASAASLDVAAQYYFYMKQKAGGQLPPAEAERFRKLLLERSQRKDPPLPEPTYDESSRPELGHHASRVHLGAGFMPGDQGRGVFQEFGIRFAYHDLLNHDLGYVPYSEIHFPTVNLRYFAEEKRFFLQSAEAFSIYSLSPWNWLKNSLSWRARIAYEVPQDVCAFCHVAKGEGSVGISESLAGDHIRLYQLAGIYAEAGKELQRSWRGGPKLSVGALMNVTRRWKHHLSGEWSWDPWRGGKYRDFIKLQWGQSFFFSQAWEARVTGHTFLHTERNAPKRTEGQFQLLFYF